MQFYMGKIFKQLNQNTSFYLLSNHNANANSREHRTAGPKVPEGTGHLRPTKWRWMQWVLWTTSTCETILVTPSSARQQMAQAATSVASNAISQLNFKLTLITM